MARRSKDGSVERAESGRRQAGPVKVVWSPAGLRLVVDHAPWTFNATSHAHWTEHAERTRLWRSFGQVAGTMVRQSAVWPERRTTPFEAMSVVHYSNRRGLLDVGNWMPATKALIDGLITDSGLWEGDGPDWMRRLVFQHGRTDVGSRNRFMILTLRHLVDE